MPSKPAVAAYAANEAEVFPVEAQATRSIPNTRAWVRPPRAACPPSSRSPGAASPWERRPSPPERSSHQRQWP